jgi:protein-tyrosine phosphatase
MTTQVDAAAVAAGSTIPPPRVLPLEGVRNFRDLGGYDTRQGRRVRWRKLFRSWRRWACG